MHERACCLWRGNLLRIENLSPSLAQLSPSQSFGKGSRREGGWEEEEGKRGGGGRAGQRGQRAVGGRGEALAGLGEWVSGWLREPAKKAE